MILRVKKEYCALLVYFCCSLFLFSCKVVRNYPKQKPFVYQNTVKIIGAISKDEKKRLTTELIHYWDDSLNAIYTQQAGIIYKLKNPPVFDSNNIARSKTFMSAYLNSQGYYYTSFLTSYHIDTVKSQIRASISININLGKSITIDSVSYNMVDTSELPYDSTLQLLTLQQAPKSLLKKNTPYTKSVVNNELDRLINWYHQNGYYKFSRENIYALIDTLDYRFLTLTLDPFKQAQLLADAEKKRKENPAWDITILPRDGRDSDAFNQFYIGKIFYYTDLKNSYFNPDSIARKANFNSEKLKEMTMFYHNKNIHFRPLREHTYLRGGQLYNEEQYYKTINHLYQIGAWKQVDIKTQIRDKDSLDLYVFMVPEKKQGYTIDQEVSRNTGDIGSGNLLGIATNFSYKNRNIWKQAIQSVTALRFGVEFNIDKYSSGNIEKPLLQTTQISLSHTYSFPRLIQPINHWHYLSTLDNKRSLFSVSSSYTDRKTLYRLNSFVTNWGYEWSKKNNNWALKLLNVELYKVDTLPGLDTLFKTNPFLRNSFKDGKVVGIILSYNKSFSSANDPSKSHYIRIGYEESGAIINSFTNTVNNVYEYNKIEAEYRYLKKYRKDELATRFFAGVGLHGAQSMPVFKQYFAGGPNSMRAWGLRQLGLGSSLNSDTTKSGYTDRFGDFMIETNLEYRFVLGSIGGVKIGSALFSDIGNVWNIKNQSNDPDAVFKIKNIGKDIAIGVGTGLRVDFSYFLIRVDFAYKLKDPARQENNGFITPKTFEWQSTRSNGTSIKNYAFQLGIGLPF